MARRGRPRKYDGLASISLEDTARGIEVFTTAITALSKATSPEDAITILRKAALLVPEIANTPEALAFLQLGMKLGSQSVGPEPANIGATCLDCGTKIERTGSRGDAPKRCPPCAIKRRRMLTARSVARHRARKAGDA